MKFTSKVLLLMLAVATLAQGTRLNSLAEASQASNKPNIVFILMDNLGYGEVGCYGGGVTRGAPTPRIDGLGAEGTRLTNFNVEAQCTPSRSALMTGRFAIRSGTHSVPGSHRCRRIDSVGGDDCQASFGRWLCHRCVR